MSKRNKTNKFYIYTITNTIDNKKYVGQTIQSIKDRWSTHKRDLRNGTHRNTHLQRAWNKYGENYFIFEIVEETYTLDELNSLEILWIERLNSLNREYGYNLTSGGNSNGFASLETRNKMSNSHKGKVKSPEHQRKITEAIRRRPPMSVETKQKISDANKGRKLTASHRAKISLAGIGRTASIETRQKLSNSRKNLTPESRRRISEAQKGRKFSLEHRKKLSESAKGNTSHLGHKHSPEAKEKMSKGHIGKKLSPEHKLKISESLKRSYAAKRLAMGKE